MVRYLIEGKKKFHTDLLALGHSYGTCRQNDSSAETCYSLFLHVFEVDDVASHWLLKYFRAVTTYLVSTHRESFFNFYAFLTRSSVYCCSGNFPCHRYHETLRYGDIVYTKEHVRVVYLHAVVHVLRKWSIA